jgi:hypothetical protein
MRILESPDFTNLPGDVAALFARSGARSIFEHQAWHDVVARHGLAKGARLALMTDDAASAGLVVTGRGGRLALCSTPYTCASAPLYAAPQAVTPFMAELGEQAATLLLTGLDREAPEFSAALAGLEQAKLATHCFRGWVNWYEAVEGCDFAAYMERRPAALRNTLARKRKKLEKACDISFLLNAAPDEFAAHYERVYRASWKTPEPFPGFMPALIHKMAGLGALRSGVLFCGPEPAAAQFWLVWAGRATIFKLAHDQKYDSFSVGSLLTAEMARTVLDQDKPVEVDFGRGDDPYKKLWLSQRRERWGIEAANPRRLGGLPSSVRIRLQKARHRLAAGAALH